MKKYFDNLDLRMSQNEKSKELLKEYLRVVKATRCAFKCATPQIIEDLDLERTRLHTELLKSLGCQSSENRESCNKCNCCAKKALAIFAEFTFEKE